MPKPVSVKHAASKKAGKKVASISGMGVGPTPTLRSKPGKMVADVRPRLFEPFVTTKAKGTGLGLAVARAIARSHGGDIALEAVEPRGASFVLTLPTASEVPT